MCTMDFQSTSLQSCATRHVRSEQIGYEKGWRRPIWYGWGTGQRLALSRGFARENIIEDVSHRDAVQFYSVHVVDHGLIS